MRKIFLAALFALGLFLPSAARATTTISGNLKDLGTNASSGFVRFTLKGCGGNQATVPGVAVLAPTQGAVWFKDFVADASGHISGTIYSTRDSTGLLGGEIQCGTSFTSVWYGMTIWVGGKSGPEMSVHAKNGTTLDPATVTPLTVNPVATAPTGDSTYARLDGGNQPFSGNVTAPNVTATTLVKGSQVQSTVSTGTAPLIVASTTQVTNLNASQLGGLNPPASAILGLTDTQAPTNKTFDISLNTLKTATNTAAHYPRNNGTQYVDNTIQSADLPGTTSNCTGNNFAQGLNAGGTPACAAVPASGVAEMVVSYGAGIINNLQTGPTCPSTSTSQACMETVLPSGHTLVRLTYIIEQAPSGCSPNGVVGLRDVTSSTNLSTLTVSGGLGFVDSGALSVAMTAGHTFVLGELTAAASCGTQPIIGALTAVIQ